MEDSGHCFKYWIEVRDLRDGTVRELPLRSVIHLKIPTRKAHSPPPSRECLQIEDGAEPMEGETWEELVAKLRARYPDGPYERRLKRERDLRAEHAMNELVKLVARSAMRKLCESSTATGTSQQE
jgi:hypothetical protein